jgi:hypothetical protein
MNPVFDIAPPQGFFKRTGLGIGAVEYGKIAVAERIVHLLLKNGSSNQVAFLIVGSGFDQVNQRALYILSPYIFAELRLCFY